MVGLTCAQKFSFAETIAFFRYTMTLLFVVGVLVLPFRAFALEIASVSYFDGYPLESRDISKVLYSPAHKKVFCLHNQSVTVMDVSATPITAKYYTLYARPNAYPILPWAIFKDMAYDEQNRKLILSYGNTLLVIDEQANVLLTSFSVQPRVPSSRTGIGNLHVHKNKAYFLVSTFTPESQYINVFASYDLLLGQYEEYFNRGPRGNYWDYESQKYVGSANNVSDGLYSDFAFFEAPGLDDEYVMLSDIVYGQSLGSVLLGNIRQKNYFDSPDSRNISCKHPSCIIGSGPTCYPVRDASFIKYSLESVGTLVNYAVELPENAPDVRVRLSWHVGQGPQSFEPGCSIPWVKFLVDGVQQGSLWYWITSLDGVYHGRTLQSALDNPYGIRFMASTESELSSSFAVSYYPPYTHTKYTTDSTPNFIGGGSKVTLMGGDVYFTGFHVEPNESYDSQRGRKDVLLLSQKTITNLTKKFSLPPYADYGLTPFGKDMALLENTYPIVSLYIINKDTGMQLLQPLGLFFNTRSLDGDAEDGLLAAGGQQGLYLIWFKQDKLITEFAVKPDSKLIYPYADGPTGTDAEAKINFTLAKDALVTVTIEKQGEGVIKTLLEDEPFEQGIHTFEAVVDKKGEGIIWKGSLDLPAIAIMVESFLGRGILIAPDGRYKIKMIAKDNSGSGLPDDSREAELDVETR